MAAWSDESRRAYWTADATHASYGTAGDGDGAITAATIIRKKAYSLTRPRTRGDRSICLSLTVSQSDHHRNLTDLKPQSLKSQCRPMYHAESSPQLLFPVVAVIPLAPFCCRHFSVVSPVLFLPLFFCSVDTVVPSLLLFCSVAVVLPLPLLCHHHCCSEAAVGPSPPAFMHLFLYH